MAIQTFTLDPNAAAPEDAPVNIRNETGGALAAGDLIYLSGWSETSTRRLVAKADADALGAHAVLVMRASLADVTNGQAYRTFRTAADRNTVGSTVGVPVYLDTVTPGGFTLTAPTGASALRQIVGRVAVVSATVGVIEFDVGNLVIERFGSNELQDAAVAAAKIAATAVDNTKLSTTAAMDNLDAQADTDRKYIKTGPGVGEFKVIEVQRDADGKLEVTYDDVAQ